MPYKKLIVLAIIVVKTTISYCHDFTPVLATNADTTISAGLSAAYYKSATHKTELYKKKIQKKTTDAVCVMLDEEQLMRKKLAVTDSLSAARIFDRGIDSLKHLQSLLQNKISLGSKGRSYNGYLDSLKTSLGFLKGNAQVLPQNFTDQNQLNESIKSVESLEGKFKEADQIQDYMQSQKELLNTQLSKYTNLTSNLKSLNQNAYYYSQQVNEYKELLHDKTKAETKAFFIIKNLPAYQRFFQKNSQLASLFNIQNSTGSDGVASLEGLQTRSAIEQLIQQKLGGAAGSNVSDQMNAAQSQMNDLKNKFPNASNAGEMPNFKPNEMKSKSFLQRLEFGANVQFKKSTQYFPTTSNIAGQIGYKFSKKGNIGIGAGYILGLGTGFNHIKLNSQGVNLRSYLEWKVKGSIYVNGGFEENYNATFSNLATLYKINNWAGSALLGVSKKYKISAKLNGNMTILYDFLASRHAPVTHPIVVRMGYTF